MLARGVVVNICHYWQTMGRGFTSKSMTECDVYSQRYGRIYSSRAIYFIAHKPVLNIGQYSHRNSRTQCHRIYRVMNIMDLDRMAIDWYERTGSVIVLH